MFDLLLAMTFLGVVAAPALIAFWPRSENEKSDEQPAVLLTAREKRPAFAAAEEVATAGSGR